ncbi:MAG: IclR family transcriptional regulator [Janthinobacterium lividum]
MSDVVRSVARVLDLLEYFAVLEGSATLADIAARFGMPKSSTLGLLRTLQVRGYLIRDERGAYRLNEAFRQHGFGWGGDTLARLSARLLPVMKALSEEVAETVTVGTLSADGQIEIVLQVLSDQPIRYAARIGQRFPAYCTAMGRILLAPRSSTEREAVLSLHPIQALTPDTVTDRAAIDALIDRAGRQGYCVVQDESDRGGTGVAMPIPVESGRPLLALNVSCISARFGDKRDVVIAALQRHVAALCTTLFPD